MQSFAPQKGKNEGQHAPTKAHKPFFQTKLTVNAPGDQYEQEADAVADRVMRMPDPAVANPAASFRTIPVSSLQRKCAACEREEKVRRKEEREDGGAVQAKAISDGRVSRKCAACGKEEDVHRKEATSDHGGMEAPDSVSEVISGAGRPLDMSTQHFMGSRMGQDFSDVRIHTDGKAAESASDINALAYTAGNHIVFNSGQYQPDTDSGKRLLAHELTHVGQQTGNVGRKPYVQRFIYWSAASFSGKSASGSDAERTMLETLQQQDNGITTQAPIPNGERVGVGLNHRGRADIYKGTSRYKIYFGGAVHGNCAGSQLGNPLLIRSSNSIRKEASEADLSNLLASPPDQVVLGEVKPASEEAISLGKTQLSNYEGGIEFARNQANCWGDLKGISAKWQKNSITRITPNIPGNYTFNPASPKTDLELSVFDFLGLRDYKKPILKNMKPRSVNVSIRGGLYFKDMGDGVIAYYYRPANLPAVANTLLNTFRGPEFQAYMTYANELQDNVVGPLTQGPQQVAPKLIPFPSQTDKPKIQRKPAKKPIELKDTFNLEQWQASHQRHQDRFKSPDKALRSKRDELEFFGLLHEAEQYKKQPVSKSATPLPDHRSNVGTGSHATTRNVSDVFDWSALWAREPMKYLGTLRKRLGGAFVAVSRAFHWIKGRIAGIFTKTETANATSDTSWGGLAIKAFWKALTQLGKLVLHQTGDLLVESLFSGVKKKLAEYIPTDKGELLAMLENNFPQLRVLDEKIRNLYEQFQAKVEGILLKFSGFIETFKNISETFRQYGSYIKWANVAIQCGSPPGFGCLKLLATRLVQEIVARILNWCWTQKKFAGLVAATGIIADIPKKIAALVAEGVEYFLPTSFLPVFDTGVFARPVSYDTDDIPCGEEVTEVQVAMSEFHETLEKKLGYDNYLKLCKALEKYGSAAHEPTAQEIRDIANKIPDNLNGIDLDAYLAKGEADVMKSGERMDVGDFLKKVEAAYQEEIMQDSSVATGGSGGGPGSEEGEAGGAQAELTHDLVPNANPGVKGITLSDITSTIIVKKAFWKRLATRTDIKKAKAPARVYFQVKATGETTTWIATEITINAFTGSGKNKLISYSYDPAIYIPKLGVTAKNVTGRSLSKFETN